MNGAAPHTENRPTLSDFGSGKIFVVEDEALIAMLLQDMLAELGYDVVGPAMRLQRALEMARTEEFDLAILDVNLANETSFPVAQLIAERGIPFIFATGYSVSGLEGRFKDAPLLQKPFEMHQLEAAIAGLHHGSG